MKSKHEVKLLLEDVESNLQKTEVGSESYAYWAGRRSALTAVLGGE